MNIYKTEKYFTITVIVCALFNTIISFFLKKEYDIMLAWSCVAIWAGMSLHNLIKANNKHE